MKLSLRALGALCLAAASALATVPAQAGPYSSLTVFGDSLSDVGNIKIASPSTQMWMLQQLEQASENG